MLHFLSISRLPMRHNDFGCEFMPLRSVIVVVVNAYVCVIRCLSITQKLIRNGTHLLPLQSVLRVHCCCPNTSHAKSSTHTEPLLSRWSFSSAQTTYEPHKENSVLLVPGRREVSLKKKKKTQCFHYIICTF